MTKKKSDIDWWKERFDDLKGLSKEAQEKCPEIADEVRKYDPEEDDVGDWSVLKLIALRYYLEVYTNIAKKWFDKIIYIDLFAGDGFNYLRGINDTIVGSPVLAHIIPKKETKTGKSKSFDEMILVEENPKKAKCLEELIQKGILPNSTIVFNKDANSPEVMNYIKQVMNDGGNNHFLAFIDPYTMQIHWNTLEELFKMSGDLIINFMASSINRPWGNYYSKKQKYKPRKEIFDNFFLNDRWMNVPPPKKGGHVNQLLEIYRSDIQEKRDVVKTVKITGNRGLIFYYMLFAIRKTMTDSPWLKAIDVVKKRVESVSDWKLKKLHNIYTGKQKTFEDFY